MLFPVPAEAIEFRVPDLSAEQTVFDAEVVTVRRFSRVRVHYRDASGKKHSLDLNPNTRVVINGEESTADAVPAFVRRHTRVKLSFAAVTQTPILVAE